MDARGSRTWYFISRFSRRCIGSVLIAGCLTQCITINIYFPAAAAEKAADQVIDNVWQGDGVNPTPAVKQGAPGTVAPADTPATSPANAMEGQP